MVAPPDLAALWLLELDRQGVDATRFLLAFARVLPSALLIPAFGLAPLATPIRVGFGLALAFSVAPALSGTLSGPWPLAYAGEFLRGLPVALAASAVLWASSISGALVDELRGSRSGVAGVAPEVNTPLGTLISLLVAIGFLMLGGPERLVQTLASPSLPFTPEVAARDLVHGLTLAVSVAAPLAVVSIVVEVAVALAQRMAAPLQLESVLLPLRPVLVLAAFALLLDRMVELLVLALH